MCLMVLSSCATWTKNEKMLAGTFVAGQVVNYSQTRYVMTHDEWYEINPMLSDNMGRSQLLAWKGATTVIILTLADQIPEWRKTILYLSTFIVLGIVAHDLYSGVGFTF